jgi:hypothetical protein
VLAGPALNVLVLLLLLLLLLVVCSSGESGFLPGAQGPIEAF